MTVNEFNERVEALKAHKIHKTALLRVWSQDQETAVKHLERHERAEKYRDEDFEEDDQPHLVLMPKGQADTYIAKYEGKPKVIQNLMIYPFFSPSKGKRLKPIEYKDDYVKVKVTANSEYGMATVWDVDILVWAIMEVVGQRDAGKTPSRTIYFKPYTLLKALGRGNTTGRDYELLKQALRRLHGTVIETNIGREYGISTKAFHWIESWSLSEDRRTGEPEEYASISLADWIYQLAITPKEILTISPDYYQIEGGLERWLYLFARKYAGKRPSGYTISMKMLYQRSATTRQYHLFAQDIRKILKANRLPDYYGLAWRNEERDNEEFITFMSRPNQSLEPSEDHTEA